MFAAFLSITINPFIYAAKYNGTEVTLTMDSCAECDVFPMVFNGTETHIKVEKEALVWINTLQSDY